MRRAQGTYVQTDHTIQANLLHFNRVIPLAVMYRVALRATYASLDLLARYLSILMTALPDYSRRLFDLIYNDGDYFIAYIKICLI